MAQTGDVNLTTFTISSDRGTIDLVNNVDLILGELKIYESCIDLHTYAEALVIDQNDVLGRYKICGDEKIVIEFETPGADTPAHYNFIMASNEDMKHEGSMKSKTYSLHFCSSDLMKNSTVRVAKSWNDQTSNILKDVYETFMKTDKKFQIDDPTKGQQRYIANAVPAHKVIDDLKSRHVSQQNESSSYTLFETRDQSGDQIIRFTTFEQMMQTSPVVSFAYTQDMTVGNRTLSTMDDMKNILDLYIPEAFNNAPRWKMASAQSSYNFHTGKQQKKDIKSSSFNFKLLGSSAIPQAMRSLWDDVTVEQKPIRHTHIEPSNDQEKTNIAEMKPKKAAYLAELLQNSMKMEVPGNTTLKVGDVLDVQIPLKADTTSGEETQMNGQVLMIRIVHKIKMPGIVPRYVSIVEAIKAGFDQGVE